jgi:TonB family protein
MRPTILFLLLIFASSYLGAQSSAAFCDSIFNERANWEKEWIGDPGLNQDLVLANGTQFSSIVTYPSEAAARGLEGDVFLSVYVDTTGRVRCLRIVRSSQTMLDSVVLNLLYHNAFRPRDINGKLVPYFSFVPVRFRLDPNAVHKK